MNDRLNKKYLKRPKKSKSMDNEEKQFAAWLTAKGCLICGNSAEFHHHPFKSRQGWSHKRAVPLCYIHHRDNKAGIHGLSELDFNALYGVNLTRYADTAFQKFLMAKKSPS